MKYFYLLLIGCLMSSCDFFQMEKRTSSDLILEEELHTINWQEVDAYPVFQNCKEITDSDPLECFTQALHNKVLHGMRRYAQTNELRSEEHTSELQSRPHLVCRLLLEKK